MNIETDIERLEQKIEQNANQILQNMDAIERNNQNIKKNSANIKNNRSMAFDILHDYKVMTKIQTIFIAILLIVLTIIIFR